MYMYTACHICSITVLGRPFVVVRLRAQPPSLTTSWFYSTAFRLKPAGFLASSRA